jgi:hypothetical protein
MDVRSLDQAVSELVREFGGDHDSDYVTHMITTALGLGTDSTSTLDLKIASSALKEMREAFAMFDPYADRKKVTIFGSARTKKDDPLYLHTQHVAAELAAQGWMVVTGAGPLAFPFACRLKQALTRSSLVTENLSRCGISSRAN